MTTPPKADPRNPDISVGDQMNDFIVERVSFLKELNGFYYQLSHGPTGARYIHISTDDKENTFGVALKTVPQDSSGVAHILEHTVLCGSQKYPVRDPFFSMLKRSLSTFMNAFTASDWTMYPFSTQNKKDFYNLMDVYLDAVFFPRLDELSFKQEGHRLALVREQNNGDAERLVYKGVVFNEMKGAMSSPDQILARSLLKALYPDTTYSHNSGGEPSEIPQLTYRQLKAFHSRHYHPSNAYFYTYGNLPLQGHLLFVQNKILSRFEPIDPATNVPSQPRWAQSRAVRQTYPLSETEDPTRKSQVCIGWLTADIKDTFEVLTLGLVEQILMGNVAAPLRKALIDSQLGSALCDAAGYDADNRDTMFVCGLKGVSETDADRIEAIIFDELNRLVRDGIDPDLIESGLHQIEFHRKEKTNTPYPYGLKQLLVVAGTWLHGGDPLNKLQLDRDLAEIRSQIARGGFLEERIRTYFLDNPHRVRFILAPDPQKARIDEARETETLNRIYASLEKPALDAIIEEGAVLQRMQDTPEDLSSLPTLKRSDILPTVDQISPIEILEDIPAEVYAQPTAGILYFSMAAGVAAIPDELIPWLPFFCYALPKVGTANRDYTDMVRRIDMFTGGLRLATHARTRFDDDGGTLPFVTLASKCLYRNQQPMFAIVDELVTRFSFSALDRLKSLSLEYRSQMESMVVHNGHRLAISLAARRLSMARALSEKWNGVHQLQLIKSLTDDPSQSALETLARRLTDIGRLLFRRSNIKMALIAEDAVLDESRNATRSVYRGMHAETGDSRAPALFDRSVPIPPEPIHEGWATATAVSFVAQAFETVRMQHPDAPALAVISKMLRSMYLHREIREKGGAYGGFALYNSEDGLFCYASYRDPHIVETLNVFEKASEFILSGGYSDKDVDEAVLQVCSDIDKPDPPGPGAKKSFYRRLIGLTDEARQRFKENLLRISAGDIDRAARRYFDPAVRQPATAVISNDAKLVASNQKLTPPLSLHQI